MAIDLIKYVPHLNVELLAACICTMSCIYTSIYTRKEVQKMLIDTTWMSIWWVCNATMRHPKACRSR